MAKALKKIFIESPSDLRAWLETNHASNESVWVVKWKKDTGHPYVSYDEIVDQCICFGWVDSLPRKLDEIRTMLRISPRNPKSNWSRLNKDRVEKLMDAGLMHQRGIEMVEHAKKTGTWDFLEDVENLVIPDDLNEELEKQAKAKYYFDRFPPSSKRNILEWIKTAKTEKTRKNRISTTATKAAKNLKANHPNGRDAGPPDTEQ